MSDSRFLVHYDGKIVYAKHYGIYGMKYSLLYETKFDKDYFKIVDTGDVVSCKQKFEFSTAEMEPVPMYKFLELLERVEELEAKSASR